MLGLYEEQRDWSTVSEGCVGDGFVGVGGGSRLSFCSSAGKSHQTGLSKRDMICLLLAGSFWNEL